MKSLNPFDYLGLDGSTITEMLNEWGIYVDESTVKHYMYIGIPILFICLVSIKFILRKIKTRREIKKWRRQKIEEKLRREFGMYLDDRRNLFIKIWHFIVGKDAKNIFIETKFQVNPPHDKEDPKENMFTEPPHNLIEFYVKKVFVKDNRPEFLYCVLGGSGMGKTTFSINLVKRYISSHTEKSIPYDIFLFSLSNETIMQDIQNVDNPERCILILDALDENTEAVKDYNKFISQLENAVQHFRIVIITCRTQFFANEESEPRKSRLTYYSKGKTFQEYTRHYITIFDDDDINNYIQQKFKSRKKRKSAKRIVEKCSSVLVRPLLLSYIEDLVGYTPSETFFSCDIYSVLIDKWIEREVNFWETKKHRVMPELKSQLHDFSEKLALNIFNNRENSGGLFITNNDFEEFLKKNRFTGPYSYSGRSLVNRDSAGNCKFAHKSFLEYFLAIQMFKNGIEISFDGMDLVKDFYHEFCLKEFSSLIHQNKVDYGVYVRKNPVLIINDVEGYILDHLDMVDTWKTIMISWGAATDRLWDWLKKNKQIERLIVFNYNGSGTLNKILQLHHLKSLYIMGDMVPSRNFVRKAKSKADIMDWKQTIKRQDITNKDINTIMKQIEVSHLLSNKAAVIESIRDNIVYYREVKE